jgi:hypothetical protein
LHSQLAGKVHAHRTGLKEAITRCSVFLDLRRPDAQQRGAAYELGTDHVYAQAVTTAKRKAQGKVVAMLRDTNKEEQSG